MRNAISLTIMLLGTSPPNSWRKRQGFSKMEVVALMTVSAMLVLILMSYLGQTRRKAARLQCARNLASLGFPVRVFTAHGRDFPIRTITNSGGSKEWIEVESSAEHFRSLRREFSTPERLVCPADKFRKPVARWEDLKATNISYFVGIPAVERQPQSIISGDNNFLVDGKPIPPGKIVLSPANTLSWHPPRHGNSGNILLGDGSVQQVTTRRLATLFAQPSLTDEFLFP